MVCVFSAEITKEPSNGIQIISLRNPSTERASKYLYVKEKQQFFELMAFNEEPRSWFANDSVYSNGQMYMTSAFDPLFWAIYYIRLNNTDKCQPIEQTFVDDQFANAYLIGNALTVEQLAMVRMIYSI